MKRILSILLSLIMVIGILPMSVFSANASIVDIPATPSPVAGVTGMGTFTDPYVATTGDQLEDLIATKKAMNIKIGSNLTLDKTLYIRAEVYINTNGKTITSTADNGFFNIKSSGFLTINGSGNISYKGDYYAIFVEGKFETSGSITYTVENKSYAVINTQEYGVVNIYGGTFKGSQIDNNGVGKIYIYGGTFEEILYTGPNAMTVIYDGTFLGAVGAQGKVYIYDGEFLDAVNAYNSGVITVYTGHFAKGFAFNNANGFHRADDKSYCVTHKNKIISDLGLYLYEEVTVYGPAFENQVPYANGKTEIDGGTMNQYESYTVGFTAKNVPEIFAELGFSVEEKLVVKDSNGKVVHSASKKGTTARGVYYNMQELDGGDYSVERIINLYRNGSVVETKMDTVKVKVNPISEQDFGFKTMTPSVSDEDKADRYTELSDKPLETQTLTFGFTPQLSQTLKDKGYRVEEKIQVTYNNQGPIVKLNSGANFNLMKYVKAMGDYQVWFTMNLYRGNEYVTSLGHIYNVTIVHNPVRTIKANVTAPVDGALPNATVTPAGEGYQTTDVDWSYY
ncbi:MAG: hypothetical protein UH242_09680, partial [Methanobrevibacter sp.]|nr:hypothetical protein [Methanobrevibacter sp.]